MSLANLKSTVVAAMAIGGVIAALRVHHRVAAKIRENEEILSRQDNQLTELAAEHERLSSTPAGVRNLLPEGAMAELERLRVEAERLRDQTNKLGRKLAQSRASRKLLGFPTSPPGYEYTSEDYARRQQLTADKQKDASSLSAAFFDYYRKHGDQFPSSLDQLAPYLAEKQLSLTGTNDFELIYPGPQDGLTNFPTQMLAVLRERQVWQAPSGRWARVYGMLTIPPRIVETDDNFQSWEAEHIITPQAAGQ